MTDSRHQQIQDRLNDAAAEHGCNGTTDLACWERYRVPSQWCLFCLMQEGAKLCASQEAEIARLGKERDEAYQECSDAEAHIEYQQRLMKQLERRVGELEAELSAVRQQQWQPIETAPSNEQVLVFWMDGKWPQRVAAMHSLAPVCPGWLAWGSRQVYPTHWMPLPKSPNSIPLTNS